MGTGACVGCLSFTCGVLVQFLPMWDSSAHVGLQCPCGALVHVWGASASRVACWFSFCPCGTPVPMWGSSAHVGLQCPCGTPVPMRGSSAHVGLQCPCGTPVSMWGCSAHV